MTQRNPMNERYQQDEKRGSTRKSAASAKPVMEAGASIRTPSNKKKPKSRYQRARNKAIAQDKNARANSREARSKYFVPDTPEYRKWRKYWWISIIVALILTTLSFAGSVIAPDNPWFTYITLGGGYIVLFIAIWIDLGKVRKLRKNYREKKVTDRSKAATRARKEERAKERAHAQEVHELAEKGRREAAEKKAARKEKRAKIFGFAKKNSNSKDKGDNDKNDDK